MSGAIGVITLLAPSVLPPLVVTTAMSDQPRTRGGPLSADSHCGQQIIFEQKIGFALGPVDDLSDRSRTPHEIVGLLLVLC
jgi:hypothetical protein